MKSLEDTYSLGAVVGRGRLGPLYAATQLALGRKVLVRVVDRVEIRERVQGALQVLSRHQDLPMAALLDQGESDRGLFYAIEGVNGLDLTSIPMQFDPKSFAGQKETVTLDDRLRAYLTLLDALKRLDEIGVNPELVRPSEILIASPFRFVLSEPGIARSVDETGSARKGGLSATLGLCTKLVLDPAWRILERERRSDAADREADLYERLTDQQRRPPTESLREMTRTLRDTLPKTVAAPSGAQLDKSTRRVTRKSSILFLRSSRAYALLLVTGLSMAAGAYGLAALKRQRLDAMYSMRRRLEALSEESRLATLRTELDEHVSELSETDLEDWRAKLARLEEAEADRLVAVSLGRDGDAPDWQKEFPALVGSALEPEIERVLAERRELAPTLGRLLDGDADESLKALTALLNRRSEVSERMLRVVLLRLVREDPRLGARAAAALATGLASRPPFLDDQLIVALRDPHSPPELALAVIGYFGSGGARERSEEVFLHLALGSSEDRYARNPNHDEWVVQLYTSERISESPLTCWTGAPESYLRAEKIALPVAALFALASVEPSSAGRVARQLIKSGNLETAEAAALILAGDRVDVGAGELTELFAWGARLPSRGIQEAVLNKLLAVDRERAHDVLVREIQRNEARFRYKLDLFDIAVRKELLETDETLQSCLGALPARFLEELVNRLRANQSFVECVDRLENLASPRAAPSRNAAIVCGLMGRGAENVFSTLRRCVSDTDLTLGDRHVAMKALRHSGHASVAQTLLEVVSEADYPTHLRLLACDLSKESIQQERTIHAFKLRIPEDSRDSLEFLVRLRRLLSSGNAALARKALSILADYDHRIVHETLVDLLDEETPAEMLALAIEYFTDERNEGASLISGSSDIVSIVREKLCELLPVLEDDTRLPVLAYFTSSHVDEALPVVLQEVFLMEDPLTEFAALEFLARYIDGDEVQTTLAELIGFTESEEVALATIRLVGRHRLECAIPALEERIAEDESPTIVLAAASELLEFQREPDRERILAALGSAFGGMSVSYGSVDSIPGLPVRSGAPAVEVVLSMSGESFDEDLVDWIVEMEADERSLAWPAILLILRCLDAGEGAERLNDVLERLATSVGALCRSIEQAIGLGLSDGYGSSYRWPGLRSSLPRVVDFLCAHYPDEPAPFLLRARYLTRYDVSSVSSPLLEAVSAVAPTVPASYERAIGDMKRGIRLTVGDVASLKLELARIYGRCGRGADAVKLYEEHLARNPDDDTVRLLLLDLLPGIGRPRDAERMLSVMVRKQSPRRDEYRRRYLESVIQFEEASDEALLDVLEVLPDESGDQILVLQPLLRSMYASTGLPSSAFRPRVEAMLVRILREDSSPRNRALAAFHLGWLGSPESVSNVRRSLFDLDADVRAECLKALLYLQPELALEYRGDPGPRMPGEVRTAILENTWRLDPDRVRQTLRSWLGSGHAAFKQIALAFIGSHGADGFSDDVSNSCQEEKEKDHATRSAAAVVLGLIGARGETIDVEVLQRAARYDSDQRVRHAATRSLMLLGDREELNRAEETLRLALTSGPTSAEDVVDAVELLALVDDPQSRELLERLRHEEEKRWLTRGFPADVFDKPLPLITDEDWGDVGDALAARGFKDLAEAAFQRAARLDPYDSEWTDALSAIRSGDDFSRLFYSYVQRQPLLFRLDDLARRRDRDGLDLESVWRDTLLGSSASAFDDPFGYYQGVFDDDDSWAFRGRLITSDFCRVLERLLEERGERRPDELERVRRALREVKRWSVFDEVAWTTLSRLVLVGRALPDEEELAGGVFVRNFRPEETSLVTNFMAMLPAPMLDAFVLAAVLPAIAARIEGDGSPGPPVANGLSLESLPAMQERLERWLEGQGG